jgi:hypothetical protein
MTSSYYGNKENFSLVAIGETPTNGQNVNIGGQWRPLAPLVPYCESINIFIILEGPTCLMPIAQTFIRLSAKKYHNVTPRF